MITSHNNEGTSLTGKRIVPRHLKLRLSVWLGKAELLSWRSLCRAGNALPGTSLSKALPTVNGSEVLLPLEVGSKKTLFPSGTSQVLMIGF